MHFENFLKKFENFLGKKEKPCCTLCRFFKKANVSLHTKRDTKLSLCIRCYPFYSKYKKEKTEKMNCICKNNKKDKICPLVKSRALTFIIEQTPGTFLQSKNTGPQKNLQYFTAVFGALEGISVSFKLRNYMPTYAYISIGMVSDKIASSIVQSFITKQKD